MPTKSQFNHGRGIISNSYIFRGCYLYKCTYPFKGEWSNHKSQLKR